MNESNYHECRANNDLDTSLVLITHVSMLTQSFGVYSNIVNCISASSPGSTDLYYDGCLNTLSSKKLNWVSQHQIPPF